MSPRPITWRRLGVSAVALATAAAGLPVLLSTAANAAPATRLSLSQDDGRSSAAAGTCTAFTVTPVDAFGGTSRDVATVTVTIAESAQSDTHDVDFCTVDGGTRYGTAPEYDNQGAPAGPIPVVEPGRASASQQYDPGPSITTAPSDSPDTNGSAVAAGEAASDDPDRSNGSTSDAPAGNNNNPSGVDRASFRFDGSNPVRFGVVGLQPGQRAVVDAFIDKDGDRQRDTVDNTATPQDERDTVLAPQRTLTLTAGGLPGSTSASDAVRTVVLTPEQSLRSINSPRHEFFAVLLNSSNDRVGGVASVAITATTGTNAPTSSNSSGTFSGGCSQSGNEGQPAACSYTPQNAGIDTVTVYVNQTTNSPSGLGLDTNEPRDSSQATTLPPPVGPDQARRLTLEPDSASVGAGRSQPFTAIVTDINGSPVQGLVVVFQESGPGTLSGGATGADGTREDVTDQLGRAEVSYTAGVMDSNGTNTITSAIKNPSSTKCQQVIADAPAGRCSDTSTVTLTAAPSPSPSGSSSPTASASPTPSVSASASASATPTGTATATAQPTPGSRYRGLPSPVRVLDTRDSRGARRSGEIVVDLSSRLNDAEATAAVLNVTVTNPTARGFLVAYPNGNTKPGTSNVNFERNQTQANEVVVGLSSSKRVSLFVDSAEAHVVVDLVGSFTRDSGADTGRVVTSAPVRALDSRTTTTERRRGEVVVDLASRLPDGATDAILNVTVQGPDARGFVVVYPTGTGKPGTSNVNFERGQTQANEVITRVGTGQNAGRVSLFIDSASSALIVDVVGAVVSGSAGTPQTYTALQQPTRALDTRNSNGLRRTGEVTISMPSSVPSGATGVVLNVTATNGTGPGFVAVYPAGTANPGTSNVNFPTNLTQANEVTSRLGNNRSVTLFVGGRGTPQAHLIVDVVGYLTNP